jgi:hypothetical protein
MKQETKAAIGAAVSYVRNKAVAIGALVACLVSFHLLPNDRDIPFVELLYAVTVIMWLAVMAPLTRLLVFPEAAAYAESGGLSADLSAEPSTDAVLFSPETGTTPVRRSASNRLRHYWFATAISYLVTFIAAIAVLS